MVICVLGASILTVTEPESHPITTCSDRMGLPQAGYAPAHSSCRRAEEIVRSRLAFPIMVWSKPCISTFFFPFFLPFSLVPLLPLCLKTLSLQILYAWGDS